MFQVPEQFRIVKAPGFEWMESDSSYGNNGAFFIRSPVDQAYDLILIASDQEGWEHVSVSNPNRIPTWNDMVSVKNLFWDSEDCVVQYHPPRTAYVNNCEFCLHLWRPAGGGFPRPPTWMVGIRTGQKENQPCSPTTKHPEPTS